MYRYKMKVILTESQYKRLLKENYKNIVGEKLMKLHNFSSQVVRDASKQLGFDFTFLLSYGAGIGALLKAVNEYLKGNFSGLDDSQIAGLTIMAISVVFLETKNYKKSLDKIDDDGLNKELMSAVSYTEKLKDKFAHLLKILGLSIHRTSNIISYSFLIPLLNTLIGVVTKYGLDSEQFTMFIESFLVSGIIAVEGVAIRNILLKAGEIVQNRNINQS